MAWGGEIPPHPAAYYRRQAARARRVAEGATTRAVKTRLLDDAGHSERTYPSASAPSSRGQSAGSEAEKITRLQANGRTGALSGAGKLATPRSQLINH
jgi:hypothetical protein